MISLQRMRKLRGGDIKIDKDVINLVGVYGEPPLLAAVDGGYVDVCKYMVEEKNANVNAKCPDGDTVLEKAHTPEIIRILKNNGAKYANRPNSIHFIDL